MNFLGSLFFLYLPQILGMSKIVVTGGAGYIGSHTVVELIENNFEPIIIDDFRNSDQQVIRNIEALTGKSLVVYPIDCTQKSELHQVFKEHGDISGVIHFAAYKAVGESVIHPAKYFHNNINGLTILTEVMRENGVNRIVFSSSCTVYGEPENKEVTEDSPVKDAASPYGYTKQAGEKLLKYLSETPENPVKATLLRYFNPIGAHPSAKIGELPKGVPDNLVPYVTQTAAGVREMLTVFGDDYPTADGTCIRDYIHVCDLARAHVKAIDQLTATDKTFDVFNLGTGKGTSVLEIIRTFEKVAGKKLPYKIGPRRTGDIVEIFANVDKSKDILGWQTEFTVEDALKHAWEWEKSLHT